MSVEYLKKSSPPPPEEAHELRERVRRIIADIDAGGEDAARRYAADLDKWDGEILTSDEERKKAADKVSPQLKDDVAEALSRVRRFAEAQMESMRDMESELSPGATAGMRCLPVRTAGCYVPGGRYAHIASAVMSVATARAAGVRTVVACSPPHRDHGGIHPAILYALDASGADYVLNLGGAHAVAAMAAGLFTSHPADVLAGPGNQYVAEAKRQLYGRTGIDMVAGPTEILVIADDTADPEIVACDLAGQAEHGPNSPAWLISLSRPLAEKALDLLPGIIDDLPEPNRTHAKAAWADFGEAAVAGSREEAAALADQYAAEHVEVQCADLDWWLNSLRNYGSLFLGEETTVAYGDKASGPNHILPTRGAARYTGGLSVAKFIKTPTWQRMTREAGRGVGALTARLSRQEGMEGHARTADIRERKWFGGGG